MTDYSELLKRLDGYSKHGGGPWPDQDFILAAAAIRAQAVEIKRLEARVKELDGNVLTLSKAIMAGENLDRLLRGRDNFIKTKGLWIEFTAQLPDSPPDETVI